MASTSQSQSNGITSTPQGVSQSQTQPTQTTASTQPSSQTVTAGNAPANDLLSPTTTQAPRPRDARTIELLLTSQGVTSYDSRVPLLLLDFAYRHTSSVLSDALHLTTDPYTSHAGAKPSGSSGAAPSAPSAGDAQVSMNAVNLAIASRQAFQFRGGSGAGGGGGASKDWLQELAKERNKVALPRVHAHEWGVRLPNERFVLSGMGWGLKDTWAEEGDDSDEDDDEEQAEDVMMGGVEVSGATKQDGKNGDGPSLGDMIAENELEEDEDDDMAEQ